MLRALSIVIVSLSLDDSVGVAVFFLFRFGFGGSKRLIVHAVNKLRKQLFSSTIFNGNMIVRTG